ncbi:MAG: hypothetical protein ACOCP8_00375 [archaeon]
MNNKIDMQSEWILYDLSLKKEYSSIKKINIYNEKRKVKPLFFTLNFNLKILEITIKESEYITEILLGKPKIKDLLNSNVNCFGDVNIKYDKLKIIYI